jgi:hypothetical protein
MTPILSGVGEPPVVEFALFPTHVLNLCLQVPPVVYFGAFTAQIPVITEVLTDRAEAGLSDRGLLTD